MKKDSLLSNTLNSFEDKVLGETVLTPKMRLALQGISQGQSYVNAVRHCQQAIDSDPTVNRKILADTTAQKLNLDSLQLYSRIKDYVPARKEEI